jgi:DNA-binding transcriptional ArsR family regulator
MTKKYLMFSLDDDKAKALAGILGNPTCKRIIDFIAEKESSEKDISESLHLPINTIEYNLKKLLQAGLIEKSKKFFWSAKGKKIEMYKISNKSIIISPKSHSKFETLASIVVISGLGAILIRQLSRLSESQIINVAEKASSAEMLYSSAPSAAMRVADAAVNASAFVFPSWAWYLSGVAVATILLLIINWRKI